MSKVTITRTVHAPKDQVWNAWADFGGIAKFHPYVDTSPLLSEQTEGVGTERQCNFYDGNHVKERVVNVVPGEEMTVDIVEGSMPLLCARAHIALEALGPDRTEVRMTMDYTPKWGFVGKAMDALMMRRQFTTILDDVLSALDAHLETGKPIGQGGVVLDAVAAA